VGSCFLQRRKGKCRMIGLQTSRHLLLLLPIACNRFVRHTDAMSWKYWKDYRCPSDDEICGLACYYISTGPQFGSIFFWQPRGVCGASDVNKIYARTTISDVTNGGGEQLVTSLIVLCDLRDH
jgi:hypothetical protein